MEKCAVLLYHQSLENTMGLIPWGRALAQQLGGSLAVLVPDSSEEINPLTVIGADVVYGVEGSTPYLFPEEISDVGVIATAQLAPQIICCSATNLVM